MHNTCKYSDPMPKMIQIRDVPDGIHRQLKARAAMEGKSLSSYLLEVVSETVAHPRVEEVRRRLAELDRLDPGETSAEAVRAERDAR